MNILIVDDDATLRDQMARFLENHDHVVTTAEDGIIALEMTEKIACDCCITDLKMPNMDGMDLLKAIKRKKPDTPVIVMAGYGNLGSTLKAKQLGALDFVFKPFRMGRILEIINKIESKDGKGGSDSRRTFAA